MAGRRRRASAHRRRSLARETSEQRRDAQVKGVAAHMKQAKAWTSVEVTERLAAQPPPPPCASRVLLRDVASMALRRRREDRTTHRPPPKPKQQTIGGPSIDFQEFVRRQGRDSSRRARKAEARQKEKPRECSFKPRLCENSKRMARNSKFDDRQNRLEARRLQRMASGDREKFSGHLESDAKNPPDAPRPRETFRRGPGVLFRASRRWRKAGKQHAGPKSRPRRKRGPRARPTRSLASTPRGARPPPNAWKRRSPLDEQERKRFDRA